MSRQRLRAFGRFRQERGSADAPRAQAVIFLSNVHRSPADQAASFTCGCNPAMAARRNSRSMLKRLILPRLISETRACVTPRAFAASVCVIPDCVSHRSRPWSKVARTSSSIASSASKRSKSTFRPAGVTWRGPVSRTARGEWWRWEGGRTSQNQCGRKGGHTRFCGPVRLVGVPRFELGTPCTPWNQKLVRGDTPWDAVGWPLFLAGATTYSDSRVSPKPTRAHPDAAKHIDEV